jgi:hypothetical protein
MALTRFQGKDGVDGPVSGALIPLLFCFTNLASSKTYNQTLDMPAGTRIRIVDIKSNSVGVVSDPSLTIGSTIGGVDVLAAVNLATGAVDHVPLITAVPGLILDVQIVTDAGDTADSVTVTVMAYVSAPPTSVLYR